MYLSVLHFKSNQKVNKLLFVFIWTNNQRKQTCFFAAQQSPSVAHLSLEGCGFLQFRSGVFFPFLGFFRFDLVFSCRFRYFFVSVVFCRFRRDFVSAKGIFLAPDKICSASKGIFPRRKVFLTFPAFFPAAKNICSASARSATKGQPARTFPLPNNMFTASAPEQQRRKETNRKHKACCKHAKASKSK